MFETSVLEDRRAAEDAMKPVPASPPKMTFEQFLAWADEDTLAELVNGEIVMMTPASIPHQDLGDWLTAVLRLYVRSGDAGWVFSAPLLMRLSPTVAREPDILFVATPNLERVKETYVDGPADLVVEIVSADSVGRDRGEKYYEYEQAGVPEYWLIDSRTKRAEFYQLQEGFYCPVPPDAEGVYRSRVLPGFWLNVNWLRQEMLPPVEEVLVKVGGAVYAQQLLDLLRASGALP
jgi:Uma2 family endonuclease